MKRFIRGSVESQKKTAGETNLHVGFRKTKDGTRGMKKWRG